MDNANTLHATTTIPLDAYFEGLEGTSPSNRYIIARVISKEDNLMKILHVEDFQFSVWIFRNRFAELIEGGVGVIMIAAEALEKVAQKLN